MIIDKALELADKQSLTAAAVSTNTSPGTFKSPKAGTKVVLPIPAHIRRYLRASFAADTATSATAISAGKVSAHVVWGWDDNIPPKGNPL